MPILRIGIIMGDKITGRGHKLCPSCKSVVGPRSKNCRSCGTGFLIKGILYPNISPEQIKIKSKTESSKEKPQINLKDYIEKCTDLNEDSIRTKYYGIHSRSWDSLDGVYRIRFCPEFMGVKNDDGKPYKLLIYKNEVWNVLRPKSRFTKLKAAVTYMIKHRANKHIRMSKLDKYVQAKTNSNKS